MLKDERLCEPLPIKTQFIFGRLIYSNAWPLSLSIRSVVRTVPAVITFMVHGACTNAAHVFRN